MAHALMLTASSSGRAPVPTGDGSTLLVDDANAIMICVSPIPSAWDPEGLALYRGGQRVTTPPMSDGTRWVLMGEERFGTFQARATGAGAPVASPVVRVVPATVSLRADRAPAGQPGQGPAPASQQGQGPVAAGNRPGSRTRRPAGRRSGDRAAGPDSGTRWPRAERQRHTAPARCSRYASPIAGLEHRARPAAWRRHPSSVSRLQRRPAPHPPAGAGPQATSPALSAGPQALPGGSDVGPRIPAPASAPPPAPRVPSTSGAPAHAVLAATGNAARRDAELPTPTATPASTIRPDHLGWEPAAHLQPNEDPPPGATSPVARGVVEVPLGEYDGRFAAVVAASSRSSPSLSWRSSPCRSSATSSSPRRSPRTPPRPMPTPQHDQPGRRPPCSSGSGSSCCSQPPRWPRSTSGDASGATPGAHRPARNAGDPRQGPRNPREPRQVPRHARPADHRRGGDHDRRRRPDPLGVERRQRRPRSQCHPGTAPTSRSRRTSASVEPTSWS